MASVVAACLNPPATKPSESPPPWILLDTRVYLAHRDDATTATAKTSRGHTIQVSIRLADARLLGEVVVLEVGAVEADVGERRRVGEALLSTI
jgi:hypothetical protein